MSNLTHDEIWDDSALVESWNQALEEYKKYHSIHASGGKVEDLPETTTDRAGTNAKPETAAQDETVTGGGPNAPQDQGETLEAEGAPSGSDATEGQDHGEGRPAIQMRDPASLAPHAVLGSGYYTGLYEGQQQQQQQQTQGGAGSQEQ